LQRGAKKRLIIFIGSANYSRGNLARKRREAELPERALTFCSSCCATCDVYLGSTPAYADASHGLMQTAVKNRQTRDVRANVESQTELTGISEASFPIVMLTRFNRTCATRKTHNNTFLFVVSLLLFKKKPRHHAAYTKQSNLT